jgi:hypothetical protein
MLYVPQKAIEWGGSRDADKILKMRQGKSFRKLDLLSVAMEELTTHPVIMEDQREWRYTRIVKPHFYTSLTHLTGPLPHCISTFRIAV